MQSELVRLSSALYHCWVAMKKISLWRERITSETHLNINSKRYMYESMLMLCIICLSRVLRK